MDIQYKTKISRRKFLYVLGEEVPLKIVLWEEKKLYLKYSGRDIQLFINKDFKDNEESIRSLIRDWYKKVAKEYLTKLVIELANKYKFQINTIRIKDVKTRWGSCSSYRNINLNYRLIMAPQRVIEYVIIHELCHLKEMNHSERFWNEVQKRMPDYREMVIHLKERGFRYNI